MLINSLDDIQNGNNSVLAKLDNLHINLYLTGSRFFNKYAEFPVVIRNSTDYDYFCQYSEDNASKILSTFPKAKYVAASTLSRQIGQYNDSNIFGVIFIEEEIKVDIQLVKYLDLKIEVQKILAAMGDCYLKARKSQKQWLWDQQYERICKERNIVM